MFSTPFCYFVVCVAVAFVVAVAGAVTVAAVAVLVVVYIFVVLTYFVCLQAAPLLYCSEMASIPMTMTFDMSN